MHLRREATRQLTTELAGAYGQIVIEDLDLAAMKQSMARRAYRRAISDAAMGVIGPQLVYKTARYGGTLTVADRWFASSQIHHGCHQPDGTPCRLIGKNRIDKQLVCPLTGEIVDRDHNAARNLRDWPDMPVDAQSVCRPRPSAVPAAAPETAARPSAKPTAWGARVRPSPTGRPQAMRPEPEPGNGGRNSARKASE